MELENINKTLLSFMIEKRRALHRIPETAYQEFKTSKYIQDALTELKLPFAVVGTGIVVRIDGTSPRRTVGFRADIDGLLIQENTGCDYSSTHAGCMHACGHDGHAAMLVGFAKYLSQNPPENNVVLVFQPAEEGGMGAAKMIESGLCGTDVFYALHIDPYLETGKIGCASGEFMAGSERFEITVSGTSRHASMRNGKQDAVLSCARIISDTNSLNDADFIFQVNIVQGGTADNVIAYTAKMRGTVRYFSSKVLKQKYENLNLILKAVQVTDEVKVEIKISDIKYPPLINTKEAFAKVERLDGFLNASRRFTAEDFSLFISRYSGALIWLGAKLKNPYPLHSDKFDFDENAMTYGVNTFIKLLQAEAK